MNAPEPIAALPSPAADSAPEPVTQRLEWRSPFGLIVVEVIGERVYVNGEVVERAEP